jgi:hypothetical protein
MLQGEKIKEDAGTVANNEVKYRFYYYKMGHKGLYVKLHPTSLSILIS